MRTPGEVLVGLGNVDKFPYNGFYQDDSLSDISFYEYRDISSEDDSSEDGLGKSHGASILSKKTEKSRTKDVTNYKLATNSVKGRDQPVSKKNQKLRKSRIEVAYEKSSSDMTVKSDQERFEEPNTLVSKHQKCMKKLKNHSLSVDGSEGFLRACPEFPSEYKDKKVRDPKFQEEANAMNGGRTMQVLQRRKKLCKASDLNSSGEKEHKEKKKEFLGETKRNKGGKSSKAKDYHLLGGMQKIKLEDSSSDSEASLRKNSKSGFVKGQPSTLEAAHLWEGRNIFNSQKRLSRAGSVMKPRELECENVAGAPLMGKQQGSNQHLMPSVLRYKNKASQAQKDLCASLETDHSVIDHRRQFERVCDNGVAGEEVSSGVTEGAEGNKELLSDENGKGDEDVAEKEEGWVMCDSCKKWRCVPASLTDMIESTNCGWFCKDNPDKNFADCSVPQEKTNREINKELDISEVSFCEEGQPQSTWTLIKHNIFQHRRRKEETLDEQMVCTCEPPEDGRPGCGEDCQNRMLNIECFSKTCPCGDACSNQQFQRRSYKAVNLSRCGKKGFGLQVLENVSKGSFIIEYVGEVLNMAAYEVRQKQYALRGQKHFYFMTLSGSEIIDACYKGNLGRFINHSCEPNCTTEKWMVNGEVCIGLFATRDLKKGEEITFDYNFVRVCGAAAKKCLCGSPTCRGFIGGDPSTPQSIVDSGSEEEDLEPIMLEESSEEESRIEDSKLGKSKKWFDYAESISPLELRNKERRQHGEISGATSGQVKTKTSIKVSNSGNFKKLTVETNEGHFEETIEEKLNKLVDENGGLSKGQPEVATNYLKLLWQTAASSHVTNGEGSRSIRDLSLMLDALLKTQSRAVLVEVLSSNGVQVVHRTIKQSRKDFKRTPILRKLLKVLDFLAVRRILTLEQINAEPTHSSVESLKESIFQLCRHADTEVRQIALNFQEKYVKSKPLRRGQSDLSKWRLFPKQNQQEKLTGARDDDALRKRKRPSRWDEPSQEVLDTTLAGGLPKSFWPFNANNLLLCSRQQSNSSDQTVQQTKAASIDQFTAMHSDRPSFLVPDHQNHADDTDVGSRVLSGIPMQQFSAAPVMGYVSRQGPICIGIPVSQFHGAADPVLDSSHIPSASTFTSQPNDSPDGQVVPFSSNMADVQNACQNESNTVKSTEKGNEEPEITFGISHPQFFQQMHGMFGSIFHPWQLQSLMAPHAWGPFLSGDARIRDLAFLNDSSPACRHSSENRSSEKMASNEVEVSGAVGTMQEALAAPLPPLPPPPLPPFGNQSPVSQEPMHMVGPPIGNNYAGERNMPSQHSKSGFWRPQKWNSPRWPKFQGNNRFGNPPGGRRDFNFGARPTRHNFERRGPLPRSRYWEDSPSWKPPNRWDHSNAGGNGEERSMNVDGNGGCSGNYNPPFLENGNPSGTMPLERPWGYNEENHNVDPKDFPMEVCQERGKGTVDAWNVKN